MHVSLIVFVQELARERQENMRLLKAHQDKDDLIGKLKEEIDLLNRVSPAHVAFLLPDILSVAFVISCVGACGGCIIIIIWHFNGVVSNSCVFLRCFSYSPLGFEQDLHTT